MAKEAVGIRLEEKAIRVLKVVAAERDVSLSALVEEAIAQWWPQQPEAKARGPLFTKEATTATPETTPKKSAAKEASSETPLAKPTKPAAKKTSQKPAAQKKN